MKKISKVIAGILLITTAIWGYKNSYEHMYQLTFLSNFIGGFILLADGLLNLLSKKNIPVIIYQMAVLCTNVVFFTCIFSLLGWHDFNFYGAFLFLHVINPLVFLMIYLFCVGLNVKSKKDYIKRIFISPFLVISYLLFDYIRYMITGNLIYGLISTENITVISAPLIGVGFYLLMAFMSYGLTELKLYVQRS